MRRIHSTQCHDVTSGFTSKKPSTAFASFKTRTTSHSTTIWHAPTCEDLDIHPLRHNLQIHTWSSKQSTFVCQEPHLVYRRRNSVTSMQEYQSQDSDFENGAYDPSASPGHVLSNPAMQRQFYDANKVITRPAALAFNPRDARVKAEPQAQVLAKYARHRNWAVWAQALVLFNVVGIPLSHGMYLEYYYTTALTTSNLGAMSVIPALQILCLMCMPILVGWLYHLRGPRSGWKSVFFVATMISFCVQLSLQWIKPYALKMIFQGPLLGAALGTLLTLSTLVLSSHYQFNLPLVSMQSGSMGFLGAIVYSMVARLGLENGNFFAQGATAGILLGTLIMAFLLIQRVKEDDLPLSTKSSQSETILPKSIGKIIKEPGTVYFILGYILVFFSLFVHPIYIVVILTQPPALWPPDTGAWALVATFATAAISACITANPNFRKRLGPVDTCIAACTFAGAVAIIPAWMPSVPFTHVCSAAYGVGLGAIIALHIKVTTVFHSEKVVWHPNMHARAATLMALGGCSAFTGLLVSAVLMENMENGVKIVACMAAGSLLLGGGLIACARWRRCNKFYVAI
jgi:hypothetical protein